MVWAFVAVEAIFAVLVPSATSELASVVVLFAAEIASFHVLFEAVETVFAVF